jgi:hypothetical protein
MTEGTLERTARLDTNLSRQLGSQKSIEKLIEEGKLPLNFGK